MATIASDGTVLDTYFASLGLGRLSEATPPDLSALMKSDDLRGVTKKTIALEIDIAEAPKDVSDCYLRLHLLSHRVVEIGRAHV